MRSIFSGADTWVQVEQWLEDKLSPWYGHNQLSQSGAENPIPQSDTSRNDDMQPVMHNNVMFKCFSAAENPSIFFLSSCEKMEVSRSPLTKKGQISFIQLLQKSMKDFD